MEKKSWVVGVPWERKLVGVVQVNAGPTASGAAEEPCPAVVGGATVVDTGIALLPSRPSRARSSCPAGGGGGARRGGRGARRRCPGVAVAAVVAVVAPAGGFVTVVDVAVAVVAVVVGTVLVVVATGAAAEIDTRFGKAKVVTTATPTATVRRPARRRPNVQGAFRRREWRGRCGLRIFIANYLRWFDPRLSYVSRRQAGTYAGALRPWANRTKSGESHFGRCGWPSKLYRSI